MTRKKLKDWVIPTLGIIVLIGALILYYILGRVLNYDLVPEDTYVTDALIDNTIEVQQEIESSISKPYNSQDVKISKYFYLEEDEESKQQQSLIRYENIYMPNTGILYSSSKEFDIISILDGKVTSVKEDEILGNIIEIEHSNNIVSIYQSIKDVQVKIGDQVKQGDVIAKSGSNKLENEQDNCLHFELYKDGTLINPEELYND
ncbi:MAG TPA: M23 family metallopeptidase [Candidatus Coprovivens excrementavium]|nr:M23 family metallopeptidase [Candidatus Coprovivens excrementavium]